RDAGAGRMGHAQRLGTQMSGGSRSQRGSTCCATLAGNAVLLSVVLHAPIAFAAERYAVVITGASAGQAYAQKYDAWRASVVAILKQKFQYLDDRCVVLNETGKDAVGRSTRENVRRVFSNLRTRLSKDDLLFVLLIGHGTTDDDEAKFNLVGPDLSSGEWAD